MPATALRHFNEDVSRSREIYALAASRPSGTPRTATLKKDLLRSSWMFAVGALDAYFCDAYADLLARTLRAKNQQSNLKLTGPISKIELPVGTIFSPVNARENWRWRLAARGLVEKDNVLSIKKIKELLNPFLSPGNRLFQDNIVDALINRERAPQRIVGIARPAFRRLTGKPLKRARSNAREKIVTRIDQICQRRHDCIHNCDRPKQAPQRISEGVTKKAIDDIVLLVRFCDSHIEAEFNKYLTTSGATAATRKGLFRFLCQREVA